MAVRSKHLLCGIFIFAGFLYIINYLAHSIGQEERGNIGFDESVGFFIWGGRRTLQKDTFVDDHIDVPEIEIPRHNRDEESLLIQDSNKKPTTSKLPKWKWKQPSNIKRHVSNTSNITPPNVRLKHSKVVSEDFSRKELHQFNDLLDKWPNNKPRAAFYILTQSSRLSRLKKLLKSIDEFYNDNFTYPIIIFYEDELLLSVSLIRSLTRSTLYFQRVVLSIPDFLTDPVEINIPCMSTIKYRNMCRFHAKTVYQYKVIQKLEYLWRLDDDSQLLKPVKYDVFKFMRERDLHYGYSWKFYDAETCVTGLWEATSRFISERHIEPKFFKEWPKPRLYYNNFEIVNTKIWLSQEYTDYVDYIDQLGGIYYHRWGDAPIHGIAVSLFLDKNQTHLFSDIGYKHNTYVNKGV